VLSRFRTITADGECECTGRIDMGAVSITGPFKESLKNYLLNLLTVNNSQKHSRGKDYLGTSHSTVLLESEGNSPVRSIRVVLNKGLHHYQLNALLDICNYKTKGKIYFVSPCSSYFSFSVGSHLLQDSQASDWETETKDRAEHSKPNGSTSEKGLFHALQPRLKYLCLLYCIYTVCQKILAFRAMQCYDCLILTDGTGKALPNGYTRRNSGWIGCRDHHRNYNTSSGEDKGILILSSYSAKPVYPGSVGFYHRKVRQI
jgi:hypothetical protein